MLRIGLFVAITLALSCAASAQTVCDPKRAPGSIGGICLPSVKSMCVTVCALKCGSNGLCIFGCELGQINDPDTCHSQCINDGSCERSCLATVSCIANGCGNTRMFDVERGTVVLNRAANVWQQTVRISNPSCCYLMNDGKYYIQNLAPGWTLLNGDAKSPDTTLFKTLPKLDPLGKTTVTLQFNRTGNSALAYTVAIDGDISKTEACSKAASSRSTTLGIGGTVEPASALNGCP